MNAAKVNQIWEQVESLEPCISQCAVFRPPNLYYHVGDNISITVLTTEEVREAWAIRCNFLLLVLAAEGEEVA